MKTARITWSLPTERESGNPLPVDDIVGVIVSLSADQGQNFGAIDTVVPGGPQEAIAPDLEDGTWIVRLVVRDTDGNNGRPVDTPFEIDTSAPGQVTDVVVDLE